ncbi:MAG: hypothetical protein ACLP4R_10460 [Solirubrobacteraceae bacterium]
MGAFRAERVSSTERAEARARPNAGLRGLIGERVAGVGGVELAGLTLIQMGVAFTARHPAVTSAINGPRTTEHLDTCLAADGIDLSNDLLARIDEIVPRGVTINVADNMWNVGTTAGRRVPPPLKQPRLDRQPPVRPGLCR